ncbi:MAG: hypothetical protein MJ066_04650 [Clostridia bacterium]|nr:hypothetical protein [Clostridia bacterium]
MKKHYLKTILYAYGTIEKRIEIIDDTVLNLALKSMSNFSPCFDQCENIVKLTQEKEKMFDLKIVIDRVLAKFTEEELELLDYKYFKRRPRELYVNFDNSNRTYFRKQDRILEKLDMELSKTRLSEEYFINVYMKFDFIVDIYKRVLELTKAYSKCKKVINSFTEVKRNEYIEQRKSA